MEHARGSTYLTASFSGRRQANARRDEYLTPSASERKSIHTLKRIHVRAMLPSCVAIFSHHHCLTSHTVTELQVTYRRRNTIDQNSRLLTCGD